MAIFPQDYEAADRLLLKGTGSIDIAELRSAIDLYRNGEYRLTPILFDLTEAKLILSTNDVATLAEERASEMKRKGLGPLALIAAADEAFGLSRMFKAHSDVNGRPQVGVFKDRSAAESWLSSLQPRPEPR